MKPRSVLIFPLITVLIITLACASQATPGVATQPPAQATATFTPVPAGPCVNVFYPLVPGYQWIYKVEDGNDGTDDDARIGLTVSSVEGSQARLDAIDLATGVITRTIADCEDGAIRNYPALTLGTLFGAIATGELTITYVNGVFMPAEADFAAANWDLDWTGDYTASGTLTIQDEGETTTAVLQESPLHLEWSLDGQETITVEAGTYVNAYKVARTATLDGTVQAQGMSVQGRLTVTTEQWYAPGVGLLKSEVTSASLTYMGISFPVEVTSELELVEFRTGE